jgi:hypothetical protein
MMDAEGLKGRALKKNFELLLGQPDIEASLDRISRIPPRRAVNPLLSLLYHHNSIIRWRTISAIGRVVSLQAGSDMAAARVTMRRLIWNLNDESGGIGWGSPEVLGEIMACSQPLALEYGNMLISYINPRGNFLEHDLLQQGVLWGLGRLFHARPEPNADCAGLLIPFLKAPDPARRGLAAWAVGPLAAEIAREPLSALTDDTADVHVYVKTSLEKRTVGDLARQALEFYQ